MQEDDILYNLIARCAAARLRNGFPLFDLLIPVILPNGSVGSILIQVKNEINASNDSHAECMLQREAFNSSGDKSISTDIKWDNDHCLKILMSLRGNKQEDKPRFHENGTLIVPGISEKVYPCLSNDVSNELRKLISFEHSDLSGINKGITNKAFQGSISRKINK